MIENLAQHKYQPRRGRRCHGLMWSIIHSCLVVATLWYSADSLDCICQRNSLHLRSLLAKEQTARPVRAATSFVVFIMAGGRRPANFANSTTRHTPSDHSFYSIWQNPHIPTTGVASPTAQVRPSTLPSNISMPALTVLPTTMPGDSLAFGGSGVNADALTPADALAAALDTAVSAAVSRVLASKQSVPVNGKISTNSVSLN